MGLAEHVKAGARLTRDTITLSDSNGSGSIQLGATFAVLSIQNENLTSPVRFRLYDTLASMENNAEINRVFGDSNVPAPITLVGDFSMSAGGIYSIDPVVFGHSRQLTDTVYYRIEPQDSQVKINRYLLEDSSVPVSTNTPYDTSNRRFIPAITASLAVGGVVSGSVTSTTIPTTYLLVSASLSNSSHLVRLRLYSYSGSLYDTTEKTRPFSTEPSASARLIADMQISGSENVNFTPKIIGVNLQNMGTSLNDIKKSDVLIKGERELYYILENINTTGGTVPISASLYVYALEG
jgi:hypothetical protein